MKFWKMFCVAFVVGLFSAAVSISSRGEQSMKYKCLIVVNRHLISKSPYLFVLKANACSKRNASAQSSREFISVNLFS